ncbi:MAG: pyridoxal phosphate-dependent aminotransferase [Candidatus Marinimicrobia bacterium]|nr:pyridoxal phosphate-dependent aminotransferase [Candidatus Neomarinimicrobiota bacterium]
MTYKLSDRVHKVNPSFTLQMAARAAEMKAKGIPVINFSVGEPDFNTPIHIRDAGKKAMDDGFTKYTTGSGMIELREAIIQKLKRENELEFTLDQILVSNGEKQSLYNACQALFQKGDEVINFAPYWVSFPEMVRLADAEPIFVKTNADQQFEPDFEDLESKITPNIKGVIMNSPSNPTGGVWSEQAVVKLLKLAVKHNWIIISDECYERLVFGDPFVSTEKINRDHRIGAEVLTCLSMSKTYAMTGWRIGYTAGNKVLTKAMAKIQGQSTSCANSIGQKASVEALSGDQTCVVDMCNHFKDRRNVMVQLLNELPGVKCGLPGGAFYAFADFSSYLGRKVDGKILKDSFDISEYILGCAQVVTVPGDGFGAPGYIRFSFATNIEIIQNGLEKVKSALEQIV